MEKEGWSKPGRIDELCIGEELSLRKSSTQQSREVGGKEL